MPLTLIAVFVFFCIGFLAAAIFWFASSAQEARVRSRLDQLATQSEEIADRDIVSLVRGEVLSDLAFLNAILSFLPLAKHLNRMIVQADLPFKVAPFILFSLISGGIGLMVPIVFQRPMFIGVILGLFLLFVPYIYVRIKRLKVMWTFTEQLPDGLESMARSLRAGHGLSAAIEMVGREMDPPIGKIFRLAYDEQTLGLSLQETLRNMTNRMESIDLEFFATAVLIQRDTGGNLAELLDKLAYVIRERLKIKGQIRIYSAQGRMTGYVLASLPFVTAFLLSILKPDYVRLLVDEPAGHIMIIYGIVSMVIGFFVIRKIIAIRI